ncbi:hypothetical protein FA95DRAFT_422244 [Auriscalpium vulgare]|uniref:Uncharacterized protein n=1 Tax=Auriscalpium vulgare TaxID=40419 RepID=A0ACB8S555_9AGAM|nr:hypothetical protein FA95DRAFT_422244 [Auriscalpium vulgare]
MAAVQRVQAGQQRFPPANGMPRQPGPPPNGQIPNGVGPVGQPPLQPGGYPMGGPGAQPNGIPGPPGSQPQNMPPQLPPGQRQMGPQQRGPNGNPQFQSPTMAPSPQAQPGQSQPQNGPMGQLGRSPHMANVNRGMPPPGGPQGMGTPMQMGQQPPTQQYQGRPPSRQDTPQHSMNPGPSPSLASHPPPGTPQDRALDQQLTHELNTLPPEIVHAAKAEAGLLDKDPGTFTVEDKHRVVMTTRRIRGSKQSPSNAVAGPSNANMQPPQGQRNPQLQSQQQMQAQQQMQTQQHRGAKRNSTSPGEEHETLPHNDSSPPDRKRPRRTPNPAEQQPPMAPMGGPFPPQQGPPGGPGPNGMMRGPGPMPGQQQMSSFPGPQGMPPLGGQPGMTMQQMQGMPPMHMGNTMSPMMNHPGAPGMMGQQMQPQSQVGVIRRALRAID